jgi:hypothetical protein
MINYSNLVIYFWYVDELTMATINDKQKKTEICFRATMSIVSALVNITIVDFGVEAPPDLAVVKFVSLVVEIGSVALDIVSVVTFVGIGKPVLHRC